MKEAEIKFICHKHGEQEIVAIGFSEIFLKCGCAWRLSMGVLSKTRENPSEKKKRTYKKRTTKKSTPKKESPKQEQKEDIKEEKKDGEDKGQGETE